MISPHDLEITGEAGSNASGRLDSAAIRLTGPGQIGRGTWVPWLPRPRRLSLVLGLIALVSISTALNFLIFTGRPFTPRQELEAIVRERIELNLQLSTLLASAEDTDQARVVSTPANRTIGLITDNLKRLKASNGRKSDIDDLKAQYQVDQEQAEHRVVAQIFRVATISDAWKALGIQEVLEVLGNEEKSIPGHSMVDPFEKTNPGLPQLTENLAR